MSTRFASTIGVASTIIAGAALGSLVASSMGARATVGLFLVLAMGAAGVRRIVVRRG